MNLETKAARYPFCSFSVVLACLLFGGSSFAQDSQPPVIETPAPQAPAIEKASNEGKAAIAQFKYPEGIDCELFAAEPGVANIVAFHRDYQGNVYVCETFRQEKGVEDNRGHAHWMDDELAAETV
ncbi:MAG: quinoprotein glucose dehydrogenase, partial [Mariniblastus sp.]